MRSLSPNSEDISFKIILFTLFLLTSSHSYILSPLQRVCKLLYRKKRGMEKEALEIIGEIRRRYDGKRRNPFAELEHFITPFSNITSVLVNNSSVSYTANSDSVNAKLTLCAGDILEIASEQHAE